MNDSQKYHWGLLLDIDNRGRGLHEDEIDFVAGLIDDENAHGNLSPAEMARLRGLHRRTVENACEDGEDEDL